MCGTAGEPSPDHITCTHQSGGITLTWQSRSHIRSHANSHNIIPCDVKSHVTIV